jgi:Ca2+-binding RTX toxin-like protein
MSHLVNAQASFTESVPGFGQKGQQYNIKLNLTNDDMKRLGHRPGQPLQLSLSPDDVHEEEELSTYLAGYAPTGFRADEASKVVLVDHDKDKFRNFSSDDAFLRVDVKGSIEGAIPEVDPIPEINQYQVVDRFLGSFVNDITEQNATKLFRPRQQAMKRVKWAIQLDREHDTWDLLQAVASWDAANVVTLGAGFEWNGGGSSDPIFDLQARIEASAQLVTDIWMNQTAGHAFLRNALVRDHMRQMIGDGAANGALGDVANAQARAVDFQIPGLPPIHIVAGKSRAVTGAALSFILGDHVVLTTSPPGVPSDGMEIASSYTFRRRGRVGTGFETREFRVENRGPQGGTMIVASMADIAVMTGNNVGGLIRDAVQ